MPRTKLRLSLQLGVTQTIGYASSFYLPAILAMPMSRDLGINFEFIFLFSAAASILAGLIGPLVGSLIDKYGGRLILPGGSLGFALGLVLMAQSTGPVSFLFSWVVMGIGAALALYDAAFATVVEVLGTESRRTIATITLIAGFASSIGWPITSAIEQSFSWRESLIFWALMNILICLPLHAFLPGYNKTARRTRRLKRIANDVEMVHSGKNLPRYAVLVAAVLFLLGGSVQVVMGYHLPSLLELVSSGSEYVLLAATLLGPGQVFARLLQVLFPKTFSTQLVAFLALSLHPISVLTLLMGNDLSLFTFAFIHGMGSGFLTVAAGTLPLLVFGSRDYGKRQGYIMASSDILLGFAPFFFGVFLVTLGSTALVLTSGVSLSALFFLWWLLRLAESPGGSTEKKTPI